MLKKKGEYLKNMKNNSSKIPINTNKEKQKHFI